jgi:hypothetical protein
MTRVLGDTRIAVDPVALGHRSAALGAAPRVTLYLSCRALAGAGGVLRGRGE